MAARAHVREMMLCRIERAPFLEKPKDWDLGQVIAAALRTRAARRLDATDREDDVLFAVHHVGRLGISTAVRVAAAVSPRCTLGIAGTNIAAVCLSRR